MARDFNQNRIANAKLVSADINTLGVTFAAQSPYRADGFLKVNVTVANANPTQKMFLEGADFTIYAIGGNVTKLSAYSLSMFKKLEQVWLFSSTMVEIEETDSNAYLDYLKPSCVIYVPSNLISNYQTAYSNLSSKFAPINEDYTLTIVGSGTLRSEIITDQLMNGTYNAQDRGACTKLVISGFDNYMDTLWGYNLSAVLPSLNNNVWYNATKIDFTTRKLDGVDELLESDITNLINGISSDKINGVTQLKFSGFSDMSVALSYDYSDLPNLDYIWLDNVRYETLEQPNGYQLVEYIESSGTQYIDTNYIPNENTKVEFGFEITNISNTGYLFGACSTYDTNVFAFSFNSDSYVYNKCYRTFIGSIVNNAIGNYTDSFSSKIIVNKAIIDKNATILDNETYSYSSNTPFTSPYNLTIFARNTNGTPSIYAYYKLKKGIRIYESNILIKNFVTCYRKSDNVIGLYDKENGVFYTNAGSGTFTKGEIAYFNDTPTYFYPLTDLVSEYDARLSQTFYLDYNGILPSYPDYQLTYYTDINCTTSILPENMVSGNRYYVKAVMVTLTIKGSGTLTSAIVEPQVAKAGSAVTKVVVPNTWSSMTLPNFFACFTNVSGISGVELEANLLTTGANFDISSLTFIKKLTLNNTNLWFGFKLNDYIEELKTRSPQYSGTVILSNCNNIKKINLSNNSTITGDRLTLASENTSFGYLEEFIIDEFYARLSFGDGSFSNFGRYTTNGTKVFITSKTQTVNVYYGSPSSANANIRAIYVTTEMLTYYLSNSGAGWGSTSLFIGFLDYTDTIPTFSGYTDTWYEDEDCTTPIATTDFVSGNRYYVKLQTI